MADQDRTAAHALIEQLKRNPWRFDFFQAMRLIECHDSDKPRLGLSRQLSDDPDVRFGQEVSLDFPPTSLASWEKGPGKALEKGAQSESDDPEYEFSGRLNVRFFGLFGPNGPLPLHLTEYALERIGERDPSFSRFADLFHHRMLCLFYRAWAEAQPVVHYDRHGKGLEEDRFSFYLASLLGLGMDSLRNRDEMPDRLKLLFAGHLSCQSRHAEGLRSIIHAFFGVPVRIGEFVGEWMDIALHEQTRIGAADQANRLGFSTVLGERVFGCQHKIRIVLGPLDMGFYKAMLPGQPGLKELSAILLNYMGHELVWELNLILRQPDIPPLCLAGQAQLGWTSWLGAKKAHGDDLILNASPAG